MSDISSSIKKLSNEQLNKITKDKIKDALKSLLKEKSFKNVTITELVKKAGVSRTAFYRNYESKEAILDEILEVFVSAIKKQLHSGISGGDRYDLFLSLFQKIKDAEEEIRLLFGAHLKLEDLFPAEIRKFVHDISPLDKYDFLSIYGAVKEILSYWISNGMVESVEEMADLCYKLYGGKPKN